MSPGGGISNFFTNPKYQRSEDAPNGLRKAARRVLRESACVGKATVPRRCSALGSWTPARESHRRSDRRRKSDECEDEQTVVGASALRDRNDHARPKHIQWSTRLRIRHSFSASLSAYTTHVLASRAKRRAPAWTVAFPTQALSRNTRRATFLDPFGASSERWYFGFQ